jgi:hypothetical protein
MIKQLISLTIILFFNIHFYAQNDIEVLEPEHIKSVVLHARKANAFVPIIKLGTPLTFSFDDIEGDEKEYTYKLTHCTANWEISNISSTEYADGFTEDTIRDYENSFNTYQNYTHYELTIPNQNMQIKISGNYLISVLDEDGEVVFTRRFIMYQQKVDVGVSIHKARKIADISEKQNIELVINYSNMHINNPSEEIAVAIYQNNDWNNVITNLKPQYFRGTQLIYKYGDETTFFGGNEYLYFDTKDYRTATNNIRRVQLKDVYESRLYVDEARTHKPYTYNPDINGNFFIRSINVENTKTEADYTKVHFVYKTDLALKENEHIYVYGAFNNWQFNEDNKLKHTTQDYYETDILLKQGFYNYTYVALDKNYNINNTIEGTHYQTENEYTVLVYYKKFGAKYDEVVGYGAGNSLNLKN